MNIYIGYKYRNFGDKEGLKKVLSTISDTITSLGHKTFILGRDEFEWNHHKRASKSILPIIRNMKRNDVLFSLVECENKSSGLLFENICAKFFGNKIILAKKSDVTGKPFKYFTKNVIEFGNYEDLLEKIRNNFDTFLN